MKLTIYLEKDLQKTVSLKELVSTQVMHNFPADFELKLSIAADSSVDILDDLEDLLDVSQVQTCKHKLEFIAHENSVITYAMRSVENNAQEKINIIEKELIFTLAGKNAQATATASCFIQDNRVYKFKTLQDHQAQNCVSNVTVKAVLDDQAKIFCNGMIRVAKGAQKTDSYLLNKNILLSRKARAVSIPQLEIEANDVKCKHGAAVSRLDDEQMFYLQSRGINAQQTRALLIDAFLS